MKLRNLFGLLLVAGAVAFSMSNIPLYAEDNQAASQESASASSSAVISEVSASLSF